MNILDLAKQNQQTAWKILEETGIIQAWENIGATVNLVGSFKSGLMMKSRDIDMHIYTKKLDISESFSDGVKSYEELEQWRKTNPLTNGLEWLP